MRFLSHINAAIIRYIFRNVFLSFCKVFSSLNLSSVLYQYMELNRVTFKDMPVLS